MSITTLDGYIGAIKHRLTWMKTGTRTLVAAMPFSLFDIAGSPGAGTLSAGNTAAGIVPTDALSGYPAIPSFAGQSGYLARVEFGSSVPCCFDMFDRLFSCGAYAYNADITLSGQPSFASRLVNGLYGGLQLWAEAVTAFTGTPSVQINYLDQDGNAGDTGVVSLGAALIIGRCAQIPLAAGDCGVTQITRVRVTVATAGTLNINILRPLWFGRVISANGGDVHDLLRTGFPQIFENSAIYVLLYADSTSVGLPDCTMQVAVG